MQDEVLDLVQDEVLDLAALKAAAQPRKGIRLLIGGHPWS
jgi:hypothetical protein